MLLRCLFYGFAGYKIDNSSLSWDSDHGFLYVYSSLFNSF